MNPFLPYGFVFGQQEEPESNPLHKQWLAEFDILISGAESIECFPSGEMASGGEMDAKYPRLSMDGFETPEQKRERLQLARQEAQTAADVLRKEFGVHVVYLFGSLLEESIFGAHSDIDLAVRGMPVEAYYRANGVLLSIIQHFEFDLVDMDACKPEILESILHTGVMI